ncbi:MAG: hypothetical protein AB1443_09885 [Pseudomonadota bacterium]
MAEDWKRAWLLALALAWMRDYDEGGDLSMLYLAAVAGQFRRPASNASNDLAAQLVLVFVWPLTSANTTAKSAGYGPVSCKTAAAPKLALIPLNPALLLHFPVSVAGDGMCQYAHQSTGVP